MLCKNCKIQKICKFPVIVQDYLPDVTLEVTNCKHYIPEVNIPTSKTSLQFKKERLIVTVPEEQHQVGICPICHTENVVLHTCHTCNETICETCSFTEIDSETGKTHYICEKCWEE